MMNTTESFVTTEIPNATNPLSSFYFYKTKQLIFLSVLFFSILIGNIVVLVIIYMKRKIRSRMNLFIANLAIADLLVAFFTVLVDIIEKVTIEWYGGPVLCKIVRYSQGLAIYGSTFALVSLSIDRFDCVVRPLKAIGKGQRIRLLIALQWMFSILFASPQLLFKAQKYHSITQCMLDFQVPWGWKVYTSLIGFAVFIIPAILIAICYITIVVVVWGKSSFNVTSVTSKSSSGVESSAIVSKDRSSDEKIPLQPVTPKRVHWKTSCESSSRGLIPKAKIKTIKMTFVIVLAFIMCSAPYWIFNFLHVYGYEQPNRSQHIALTIFFNSLAPLNSAANPVIFMVFNSALYAKCCPSKQRAFIPMTAMSNV